jgi:hypothetical protein
MFASTLPSEPSVARSRGDSGSRAYARAPSRGQAATHPVAKDRYAELAIEKVTAEDVTEEYIDLEAELRTKGALEAQFLEVLQR